MSQQPQAPFPQDHGSAPNDQLLCSVPRAPGLSADELIDEPISDLVASPDGFIRKPIFSPGCCLGLLP